MVVHSREETKFLSLMQKTMERASTIGHKKDRVSNGHESDDEEFDWRFAKFVETLETWLEDLQHHPQSPSKEVLKEYQTKIEFLRQVLANYSNETCPGPTDTVGSRRNSSGPCENSDVRRRSFREESPFPSAAIMASSGQGKLIGGPITISHGPATTNDTIAKEIHQKIAGRQEKAIRDELMGGDGENEGYSLRQRRGQSGVDNDLDSLLRAHHADQEQVAEEMLSLTRALKEQAIVAGQIVQKDIKTLEKSNDLAERNRTKLAVESDRLAEARSQFSCRCWIWLLVGSVSITFVAMVWVMKFFRKRRDFPVE